MYILHRQFCYRIYTIVLIHILGIILFYTTNKRITQNCYKLYTVDNQRLPNCNNKLYTRDIHNKHTPFYKLNTFTYLIKIYITHMNSL